MAGGKGDSLDFEQHIVAVQQAGSCRAKVLDDEVGAVRDALRIARLQASSREVQGTVQRLLPEERQRQFDHEEKHEKKRYCDERKFNCDGAAPV